MPEKFGLNENNDLILLTQNLRNTVEIADWFQKITKYGSYDDYSGVSGLDVTSRSFSDSEQAIKKAIVFAVRRFMEQQIDSERIVILSYYKLKNLFPSKTAKTYDYIYFEKENVHLVEPHNISEMPYIQDSLKTPLILFKTITAFKGLERDIVFLVVPGIENFKKKYGSGDRFDNYMMQLYVGASRAKYKLYFITY